MFVVTSKHLQTQTNKTIAQTNNAFAQEAGLVPPEVEGEVNIIVSIEHTPSSQRSLQQSAASLQDIPSSAQDVEVSTVGLFVGPLVGINDGCGDGATVGDDVTSGRAAVGGGGGEVES